MPVAPRVSTHVASLQLRLGVSTSELLVSPAQVPLWAFFQRVLLIGPLSCSRASLVSLLQTLGGQLYRQGTAQVCWVLAMHMSPVGTWRLAPGPPPRHRGWCPAASPPLHWRAFCGSTSAVAWPPGPPGILLHQTPWQLVILDSQAFAPCSALPHRSAGFLPTAWPAPLCPRVLALAVSSIPLLGLSLYITQVSVLMYPHQDVVPDFLLPVNSPSLPQSLPPFFTLLFSVARMNREHQSSPSVSPSLETSVSGGGDVGCRV